MRWLVLFLWIYFLPGPNRYEKVLSAFLPTNMDFIISFPTEPITHLWTQ
jgi:hypothetical protein